MALIEPTNPLMAKIVKTIAQVTPRCHDMTRLLSASMDRDLPLRVRILMRLHYTVCDFCRRYRDHLAVIRAASRELTDHLPSVHLSAAAKERMKRVLAAASQ